ncbi:hypothetical protein, variant 1 [Aphanomyces invadans]|uniref:BSD domain-containing protein n=1 Tax=Aphanomyces invadans TaxID=157072 RepID=A0A024TJ47_9STRA|nr:hypothetical protein, variant 1 [Aphanomyces invadans]ETV93636.1 hypothetical protein, variant 1 [Aphanomyces invadans]|eukprot:XP_008877682.1 hypothetical protein, variant 1 [Aphanomyces invadans]
MAKETEGLPPGAVHVKCTEKKEGGKKEEVPAVILLREALWMKTATRKLSIAFKDIQDLQVNAAGASATKAARFLMRFRVRSQPPISTFILEFANNDDLQRTKLQLSHCISSWTPPSQQSTSRGEGVSEAELKLRQQLLQKHPNTLKRQYTDMVTGGLISENDFWNLPCRKQLLLTEQSKRQRTGKTSEILSDVQGENQSGGKSVKYNLNPEIIHQIFVQYPVVYLAYQEQVPDKMTGLEFWGLFVKSKYAHRDKNSLANGGAHALGQPEDLFTRYEEKYEAKLKQSGPRDVSNVDPLINLAASYTDDAPDPTAARATTDTNLAKFNRHAADVLQVKVTAASAAQDSVTLAVELDDLAPTVPTPVLPLSLENASRYFEHDSHSIRPNATKSESGGGAGQSTKWHASQVAMSRMMLSSLDLSAAFPANARGILKEVLNESDETNALDQANKHTDTRFISSNFKTQLTNHFHDVSELLRHYLSFKAKATLDGTAEARSKLERIKVKMGEKFEYLEHIRNKLPPAEKTTLAPLLTPFLDQLNIPFLDEDSKAF